MNVNEVTQMLQEAQAAIDAAGVAKDIRAVAFDKAVGLLAGSPRGDLGGPIQPVGTVRPSGDSPIARIAAWLGLEEQVTSNVFAVVDDQVHVMLPTSALDSSKRGGTQQLALLVAAMNEAGGEQWTPVDAVRPVAEHYGRYDSPNHSKAITGVADMLNITGSGKQRRMKLRAAGKERVAQLVEKLGGSES